MAGERHDVLRPVHEQRQNRSPRRKPLEEIAPKQSMIEPSAFVLGRGYEAEVDRCFLS